MLVKCKASKFNHYVTTDNKCLIYNSLTQKLGVMSVEDYEKLYQGDALEQTDALKKQMDCGFWVNNQWNEDALGSDQLQAFLNDGCLNLTVLASEGCNFSCTYCFDEFNGSNITKETAENIIWYLQKNIRKYAELSLDWFGGEPLLAKEQIFALSENIIEICRKTSRPYNAIITTNGYLLDVDTFQKLLKYRVKTFIITIDGLAQTHDVTRPHRNGSPTFNVIIDNLRKIRDLGKKGRFRVQIRTNVTAANYDSFPAYLDFLYDEFGENPNFSFMFSPVYDWGGQRVKDMQTKLVDKLEQFYDVLVDRKKRLNLDELYFHLTRHVCSYAKRNSYTVRPNGEILICPQLKKESLGRLADGDMVLDEYKIARWHTLSAKNIERCTLCNDYALCEGRTCPANLLKVDDTTAQIPCGRELSEVDQVIKTLYKTNHELFEVM